MACFAFTKKIDKNIKSLYINVNDHFVLIIFLKTKIRFIYENTRVLWRSHVHFKVDLIYKIIF